MISLITALLILIVNIITTEYIAKKKFKALKSYLVILFYTLTMVVVARYIIPILFSNPNTALVFIFLSWSYLFVFIYLYSNIIKSIIIIMAFSLTHTLFINGFIYHLFILLFDDNLNYWFIITQVVIFSITTPIIIFFINNTVKEIIKSINFIHKKTVMFLPLFNFFIMYISRFLIDFNSVFVVILFYTSMFIMIVLTYFLINNLIKSSDNIKTLNSLVYIDSLTRLKNRLALFHDFKTKFKLQSQFNLFYLDLDKLKTINDKYGHIKGDVYLKKFSESLIKAYNINDNIYRISGDEFIVISLRNSIDINNIKKIIEKYFTCQHHFFGVSIGKASYPKEGKTLDDLLNLADERMYKDKNNKE